MRISALVLNYKSPRVARLCVQALLMQSLPKEDLEILLIDNHSNDESIQWLRNSFRSEPRVKFIEHATNKGYGQGNDATLHYATGDAILVINPDNILEEDGLQKMRDLLLNDSSIGVIAPRLIHEDGTIRDSFRAFPRMLDVIAKRTFLGRLMPKRVQRYTQPSITSSDTQDVDWAVGACLLFRRDLYEQLGGFDPRFFLFFEDIDFCRRTWELGKRVVYMPSVSAKDRKRRLSEGGIWSLLFTKVGRIHISSAIQYFLKWQRRPLPVQRSR